MKQRCIKKIVAAAIVMFWSGAAAQQSGYDFSETNSDGKVLYYEITDVGSVTVSGHRIDTADATTVYTGTLAIPDTVTHDGVSYAVTAVGDSAFFSQTEITSLSLPPTLRTIGAYAFHYCRSLTAIDIPEGVTEIGTLGFGSCRNATRVDIPSTVIAIGSYAFYALGADNSSASVTIHNAPCVIAEYAFHVANAQFDLGNSVVSIGAKAFEVCPITDIVIPQSVRHIGYGAFNSCIYLQTATLPNTLDTIPAQLFYGCLSLEELNIPDSLKYIGDSAFTECLRLYGDLLLPENLDYIGAYAFAFSRFSAIVSLAAVPPTAFSNTFDGISTSIIVVVPCGSHEAYAAATGWNRFTDIVENCDGIDDRLPPAVTVGPVPASDHIAIGAATGITLVEAFSENGALAYRTALNGHSSANIDVSRWPTGSYLLRIHTSEGVASRKLVVRH